MNLRAWFAHPKRFSYLIFFLTIFAFLSTTMWLANGGAAASAPARLSGDTCVNATVINPSALPFIEDSTTEGASNDIDPTPAGCVQGAGADVVYSFTPNESAVYNLGVTPTGAGFDPSFYIITDCADPVTSCLAGANNNSVGKGEFLSVNLA